MESSAIIISPASSIGANIAVVQLKELDCQGCADNIRSIIGNFDGVHSVRASIATKQVTVEYEFPFTEEVLLQQLLLAKFEIAEPTRLEVHEAPAEAVPA